MVPKRMIKFKDSSERNYFPRYENNIYFFKREKTRVVEGKRQKEKKNE